MTNQTVSVKKNTERIRICVLLKIFFLYISLLYFGNAIATNHFFSSCFGGNSIATNQLPLFFSLYFNNAIATNQLQPNFCFLLFRQCHCHKFIPTFFPLYFGNGIAKNQLEQFFFPPISVMSLPQIHSFLRNDMSTQILQYFYNKF